MAARLARTAVVALLWISAGCTFTGLGRYDIARCNAPTSLDEDPCRALDDLSAGCVRYRCDDATGTCQRRSLDEICDGVDNDCNGIADDDLVVALSTRALLPLPASSRDVSLTSSNGHDLVGAAVVDDAAGPCILAFRASGEALSPPCTFPARPGITPRQPAARPIVAEDLTFGAAFVTAPASCRQGLLGFRSSKGGAVDGACVTSGASLPSFLPYPDGKAIVAAYVGRSLAEPARDCASTTPAPLGVAWIDRPTATSTDPQPRIYAERRALGSSLSTRPPALAPLGESVLLAAPADGAVGVWSLRAPLPDGSGESIVPLLAPQSLDALAGARAVAIALAGPETSPRLAIVAEIGCPPAQRVAMVLAQLTGGGPVATVVHVSEAAPASLRATAPQIAWIEERKEWWVSWLAEEGSDGALRMRRFNANGAPAGEAMAAAPAGGVVLGMPNADVARGASAAIDFIDARGLAEASLGCR